MLLKEFYEIFDGEFNYDTKSARSYAQSAPAVTRLTVHRALLVWDFWKKIFYNYMFEKGQKSENKIKIGKSCIDSI